VRTTQWVGSLVVAAWALAALPALAAEVGLTVAVPFVAAEGGVAQNRLRLGLQAEATDAFDPRWDAVAAFPSAVLTAAIVRPGYPVGQRLLWWDVRGDTLPQTWDINVASDQPNAPITMTWTAPPTVADRCALVLWTLQDTLTSLTLDLATNPAPYHYTNQVGVSRRFVVTAASTPTATPPAPPFNLWSPRQGRSSVYLAWSGGGGSVVGYHVYREDGQGRARLTTSPQSATSYLDAGLDVSKPVTYRVTAVDAQGCESAYSAETTIAPRR